MLKKKTVLIVTSILLLLTLFLGGVFAYRQYQGFKQLYFNSLKNDGGRVNFLILGINGAGGLDKDLTDTIIFASINQNSQKMVLFSIPRDIWVEEIKAKINTAYHYGGVELAKKTLENISGQLIHYYAIVNFDSFERIIDYLGGVEVEVEREFDDYKFPIPGKEKDMCDGDREYKCRYEYVHFDAGKQVIDGKTALKFIRSRNSQGDEGSDFARSARQQKLIQAIKDKIVSKDFYLQPKKILGLLVLLNKEVNTDMEPEVYGTLAKLGWDLNKNKSDFTMTALNGNLFVTPKYHYSKQWVLIPKSGRWNEVREFIQKLLD